MTTNSETSGKAGRVDVLAVLDRQMEFTIASDYPGAYDDHRDMVATRFAVAELIEAARDATAVLQAKASPMEQETPSRLYAALARVGGAA